MEKIVQLFKLNPKYVHHKFFNENYLGIFFSTFKGT